MLKMMPRALVLLLSIGCIAVKPAFALQMLTEEYPPYNYTESKALIGISTEIVVEMTPALRHLGVERNLLVRV